MPNSFAISDTHFSHKRILEFMRKDDPSKFMRPFASLEEMNETMVERWNARVGDDDTVYHLGDFSFGGKQNIAIWRRRLKGKIKLILGNHDYSAKDYINLFDDILGTPYKVRTGRGTLLLTHAPIFLAADDYHHAEHGRIVNVHGHLHDQLTGMDYHESVCVEQTNFEPIAIDEIVAKHF
jgi:calcineurin-like phosphoesterase family protein